jgi:RHS repeat-associated protein
LELQGLDTGLDYFGARYMSGAQGRFTSPDPVFMTAHRVNDPQQWNLYAYSRNNPLRFTDPTGLDIWLQGCGDESDTCHKGYVGSYDDNGSFNRTHLNGDLTDSASLGTTGISVDYNGGTYQGVWDTNKNEQSAVTVGGSGTLSDLSFTVNGNCNGTCQASGFVNGTNTVSGLQSLQFAVTSPGSGFLKDPGTYSFDPFHPGRTNFMGYDPDQPQGLPSTHLPVPPSLIFGPNGQPTNVDFHVDQRYPFEDVTGFANHVGSIGHTLFNDVRSIFTGLVDHGNH